MARTLVHESIHAEIFSQIMESATGSNLRGNHSYLSSDAEFKLLWEMYHSLPGDFQHEMTADNYTSTIALGIKNYISNNNVGLSFTNEEINLMCWRGLEGTDEYKLKVIADPTFLDKFNAIKDKIKDALKNC